MTQDMTKDTILQNIAKRLVRHGCTRVFLKAYCSAPWGVLHVFLLLLMMTVGVNGAWGQTDYSGTYYIASGGYGENNNARTQYTYNFSTPTNNFYLCPTEDWCYYKATDDFWPSNTADENKTMPFLTTYKCRDGEYDASKAVWIIKKAPNSDYYYIIQKKTGRYLVANGIISTTTNGWDRMRVHLEEVANPSDKGNNILFKIYDYTSSGKTYKVIQPMGIDEPVNGYHSGHNTHKWLTVNTGNYNNLVGNSDKGNGPTGYTNTAGIVGIYIEGDANAPFYFEDCIPRPTITYNDASDEITITASQSVATLIYTTDGSTPTTSNGTLVNDITITFNPSDGATTIKAVAVVNGELSNIATFTTPVFFGSNHKYLIQSQNNGWTVGDSPTDFHFYMIPGDDVGEEGSKITKVNTTSLFRPSMEWYFLSAGVENGVQYYYIVNKANSKYLCYDGTNKVYMADHTDDNKFKFKIVESPTTSTYNIYPYGQNILINKDTDNASNKVLNTANYSVANANSGNTRWKFVLPTSLDKTVPFEKSSSSTGSYTYYQLRSSGDAYYIKAPASANANATMVAAASADENTYWYLEEAAEADWLTYYYIRNAKTGDYLYYANDNPSNGNAAFKTSTTNGDADRYQFAWAHSTTADYYFIVPKMLRDETLNNYSTMNRNSGTLRVQRVRATGSSAWFFSPVDNFTCAQPVIEWSDVDGGYVVTSTESDAKIYYKIGEEGELTPTTGTLYTGAISVADLGVESATIRVIAARNSDGSDASTEASVTVNRVATPEFSLTEDGKVELNCATDGVSYYYEIGTPGEVDDPTKDSTPYSDPIENAAGKVIKAIAVKDGWINSAVAISEPIDISCATPVIRRATATTFTIDCVFPSSGVTIYYTTNGDTPTSSSSSISPGASVTFDESDLPLTVKAIAVADDYSDSEVAEKLIPKSLTPGAGDYCEIASVTDFDAFIDMVNIGSTNLKFKITDDIDVSSSSPDVIDVPFTGELVGVANDEGTLPVIKGLKHAIFNSVNGGIVKNVILDNVKISGSGNKGAIANEATGDSRIYNCGVLATGSDVVTDDDGYTEIANCSSEIKGSASVGGIVGLLDGTSRVINCFSYANITGGNLVGGIVGENKVATTAAADNLKTMVMNCMFYGEVSGSSVAPIYNGEIITNDGDDNGVNNFNYFWAGASYVQSKAINVYNCALSAETRYLQRFEFFRHLLNSNRELAAWWATDDAGNKGEMMKWVLEPSQIGTSTPYPILKAPDRYPSVVNIDVNHSNTYKGRDLTVGSKFSSTLSVTIRNSTTDAVYGAPTGADITTTSLNLNITDKDPDHFNFNYGKVQLPYYNDVGTKNYTGNRVVTGWKIVVISGGSNSFSTDNDDNEATTPPDVTASVTDGVISLTNTPYNFADRNCTDKDLYSVSGRVFSQGAYFDVPEGVSAITIEPYWGKAVYLSDAYWDVTYKNGTGTNANNAGYKDDAMTTPVNVSNVGGSQHYENGQKYNLATHSLDETNGQIVYTSLGNAISSSNTTGLFVDIKEGEDSNDHSVYDYAVVLVGNYHHNGEIAAENSKPYTVTSIDLDGDNEPDYSFMLRFNGRIRFHPVRYDFLNLIGLGMAQKTTGGTGTYNFGIMQPKGWFECTNTGLFRVTQFEYDLSPRTLSPIILQGGVMEQWVTHQNGDPANAVEYYHVGGNVWFKEFHIGVHQDKVGDEFVSPHPPISVTGGDFNEFYLTGLYNTPNANFNDNAECYINGGRFGKVAGTGMQGIGGFTINETTKEKESYSNGNIIWQIDNADIDEFYGGGINAAHISEGDIMTVISNSRVDQFCGGPKFGDMNHTTKVVTNADNCTFRTFFGAGYGGNSYNRRYPTNKNNLTSDPDWNGWVSGNEGLKYRYNSDYSGVETRIDYQYIPMSNNTQSVARLFVDYVSFSLATTYDVTSILTDCTITTSPLGRLDLFDQCLGNFYGGGSLGKVVGNVKSTLTNCTVEGNVFGAGYSASLPPVQVMAQSFQNPPRFDNDLGAYLEAELPATTSYDWVQSETEINSDAKAINRSTKKVFTTENLDKSSLGSINGNVTLTITTTGTKQSKIGTNNNPDTGHVYGGGQESYVTGETNTVTVNILGNTEVLGDVFGGGDEGDVEGKTLVNIGEEPTP